MTQRAIPKWIVATAGLGARCTRCGGEHKPDTLPLSLDAWVAWSHYVGELHRFCVEGGATPVTA